ncbi:protocatechuate 3,4-dioxygenase, partial [Microbacterium sp. HSID17254]|uniref:DODA-type extradiol aromatic ring-opening family dioxygenase n=1 Tax=Microbacterium sp. HSID17254 TaxID=2419509 RepID=UPI000F89A3DB
YERYGRRPVADVTGDPDLAFHRLEHLVDDGLDLTVCAELYVDHGFTVPRSVWTPDPGDAWPCPVVPVMVNVIRYPQPTAARCYALGQAIGRALASYDGARTVGILGTGGMSHQLAGTRAGFVNPGFDHMFLAVIADDPQRLTALHRDEYIRLAGCEGIELIMWLVMRGAVNARVRTVHTAYHVPASNTAAGRALLDNRGAP